ncbi:hypothetical protein VMCG_03873 [Cytospora schulzeri]|uniref:Uncharacterized protein n=1 Tax=Cytospora schulzeri TaxID=448051 RepID=A0A423WUY4_9PEZI|nr:hypothetical protein VMCG_03873 [Valsa malicola]
MDGAHRKIELQSPEDLAFLINNVRRAATEHVTAAFPPVDGQQDAAEEDELRVRIEKLVDDTFTLAAPNLSINGFDLDPKNFPAVYLNKNKNKTNKSSSPNTRKRQQQQQQDENEPEVQYEPFDGRKRLRVEELAREEEDLMREIAALKRKVPLAAARGYADGFWEGVRGDEEALARARAVATSLEDGDNNSNSNGNGNTNNNTTEGGEEEDGGGSGSATGKTSGKKRKTTLLDSMGPLERQADVEKGYEGVIGTLSRLKRDMPATVAKMERARIAGQYVVTESSGRRRLCGSGGRGRGTLLGGHGGLGLTSGGGLGVVLLGLDGGGGITGLLLPLGGLGELGVLPGADVAEHAAAGALAAAAKDLGQALGGDVLEQLLLVAAAQDVDLLHGDGVDPALDGGPDGREAPGRVDDEELAEALRVVVLGHVGGLLQVAVDRGRLGQAHALEVHDGAARLEQVASLAGAGGQAGVGDALVLDGQVGQHALRGGDLVDGADVDVAELLDVDWSALLFAGNCMLAAVPILANCDLRHTPSPFSSLPSRWRR